ncbi:tetratricopeptide repeat-containing sulfotransferase family protein [Phenylobacterium koreense]|uniref:Tetratricopeptide (TPR) repeat protein n=1 Tax=Phenylobacterium koreense TaxID=266125 RepID=A0ABV2ELU7_9CAUL
MSQLAGPAASSGKGDTAEALLRRAVELAPGDAQAHADLASLLMRLGRAHEAIRLLDEALVRTPAAVWPLSLKAAVLEGDGRLREALDAHRALLARAPRAALPWTNYGRALAAVGDLKAAIEAYRNSLAWNPNQGFAWLGLANLRTLRLDPQDVAAMEQALPRVADSLSRTQLHYALGKALGDQGRFAASFQHYEAGNSLRGGLAAYDADLLNKEVDQARATFTSAFLDARRGQGCQAPDPIFIVGMPRSGSTLVEQILASHPLVEGLGELAELGEVAAAAGAEADGSDAEALGERYLAAAGRRRRTERPFFTDKMPANWRHVGLIQLILPKATIIDVRREPMACCFSSFTTYFNRHTSFPATLPDLARYYRDYVRAMDHFDEVAPGRVHHVQYERLVDDLEGETRRLLDHVGLPFAAECLRFHENPREVQTPSAQQVRGPINLDGLDRWLSYESWLAPLKQGLEAQAPESR